MLLYEIADDVHWLMLTNVKHIKKSVLCAQGQLCTLANATYEQTTDLSLYIWYNDIICDIIYNIRNIICSETAKYLKNYKFYKKLFFYKT